MRTPPLVARAALAAVIALVAAPGLAGSVAPSTIRPIDPARLSILNLDELTPGPRDARLRADPRDRSASAMAPFDPLVEPSDRRIRGRTPVDQPQPAARSARKPGAWRLDRNVSWYGPGFYGNRTACGLRYTRELMGVAHRTLPCGTKVTFRNPTNGASATVPVIDRGPYVAGRQWDLSAGLCLHLDHCYTGRLYWRYP